MFHGIPVSQKFAQRRNLHWLYVVARLKPGVTMAQAAEEMRAISERLAQQYPDSNGDSGAKLQPLRNVIVGRVQPVLLVVFGAAALVLLIACANVANVLLARSAARRQEIAIRYALGASRRRVIRQLLTESTLLAMLGGALALLLGRWALAGLVALVPAQLRLGMPFLDHLQLDASVLAFTAAVSLLTGILFGLAPAITARAGSLNADLTESGRTTIGARGRMRDGLVVAEIGIAAALLVGSVLLLQSLWRVLRSDPGFNRHGLLTLRYALPPERYSKPEPTIRFHQQLEEKLRSLPGVQAATVANCLPLSGGCGTVRFRVQGAEVTHTAAQPEANSRNVGDSYFRVLEARLLKGRYFDERDGVKGAPPVIIVNRTLAEKYFAGDAVGKTLTFTYAPNLPPQQIIAVVDDVQERFLDSPAAPTLYAPESQNGNSFVNVIVRVGGDPALAAGPVREAILAMEPGAAIFNTTTLDAVVANSLPVFLHNLPTVLVSAFGSVALLLVAIGVYGLLSYLVTTRTRELGIRVALGATARDVLRLVMKSAARLTLAGLGVGLVLAIALARLGSSLLVGVRAFDPLSFVAALAIVAVCAMLASYLPARRAARLDPMVALRHD